MSSNGEPRNIRNLIITVSASSKKAGKSAVARHLVGELGADYGLKVSSGSTHAERRLTSDPEIISKPGTDTGALVEAGAKEVLWVDAPPSELQGELNKALSLFLPGGLLVIEGNSALEHVSPDFAIFLMSVPFDQFKPSAAAALEKSDLVLVNRDGALAGAEISQLERELLERAPGAKVIFYDKSGVTAALAEAVRLARAKLSL